MVAIAKRAPTNAGKAKGSALANVLVKYATEEALREEKKGEKLKGFIRDIHALDNEGHKAFRQELTEELAIMKMARDAEAEHTGVIVKSTMGYSFTSFTVMVSNFKTISYAAELGYRFDETKTWPIMLAESVGYKHAQASKGVEVSVVGAKRGRKAKLPEQKSVAFVANVPGAIVPAVTHLQQCINLTKLLTPGELGTLVAHIAAMQRMATAAALGKMKA